MLLLQNTFKYHSSHWTENTTYNDNSHGRDGGLDNQEFKGSTYWRTSFKEICVGMKHEENLKAFSFLHSASSLYSLIADGEYRQTNLGRNKWKWLISGSSLQYNCNKEGFNVYSKLSRVRLGLIANNQDDCESPDSFIGLGAHSNWRNNAAGNLAKEKSDAGRDLSPDNGEKNLKLMGYILVR